MYLAASAESISVILLAKREKREVSIYFVSRAIELGEQDIEFIERNSVKGKILANLLAETPSVEDKNKETKNPKVANEASNSRIMCKFYTNEALSFDGSSAGLMLVSPEGKECTYTLRFKFETTNNEAKYEALLAGLRIAKEIKFKDLGIFIDSQLVANQVKGLFKDRQPVIKQYFENTKEVLRYFDTYSMEHSKESKQEGRRSHDLRASNQGGVGRALELMLLKTSKIYTKGLRLLVKDLLLPMQVDVVERLQAVSVVQIVKTVSIRVNTAMYKLRLFSLSSQVVSAAKLPILNPNEFDLWKIRIEQYFLMTDYLLWEVILNGDSPAPTRVVEGVVQSVAPTTAEQRLARKNELKAHGTLLMALPDKHQLKFNIHKDAKTLMEEIEKRFGGNKETKKVQKTLLKQQYENFTGLSSESLDQIHDRLQKLIGQLEILGESLSQEDINLNLNIYEAEVKSSSSASTSTQNIAFVSSQNTDSTNEPVSVVARVSAASAKIPISALPNMDTLSNAMAMLTVRARRFLQRTGRNLGANGPTSMGLDMSKVECYNCIGKGTLQETCDGVGSYDWSFQEEEEPTNYALMAFPSSSSSSSDNKVASCSKACTKAYATLQSHYDKLTNDFRKSQFDVISYKTGFESVKARLLVYQQNETVFEEDIKLLKLEVQLRDNALVTLKEKCDKAEQVRDDSETDESLPASPLYDRYQSREGYHVVPPPYTRTCMPPKPNLVFHDASNFNETVHTAFNVELSPTKPDKDLSHTHRPSAPIIEDWVSDSEDASEAELSQNVPSFVPLSKQVKTPRPFVKPVENFIPAANPKTDIPKPQAKGNSMNRKACFVYKSFDPFNQKLHVVPTAVLTKSKLVPLTAVPQPYVTRPRPAKTIVTKSLSPPRRNINRRPSPKPSNFPPKVTIVKGNPHHALKDKRIIDSGCSRHMTGNMSYLSDFKELNGGYVAFGGNPNGGKITKKGKIRTDTECIVLSLEFKLSNENQVLLRVPRENNMYNVDLKNIVLSEDLTYLFEKATFDESSLWHRRLGSHGVLGEVDGTIQVDAGVRERAVEEKGFWQEIWLGVVRAGSIDDVARLFINVSMLYSITVTFASGSCWDMLMSYGYLYGWEYVIRRYVDQLERLGYMLPQDLIVGLILNGLTKDFARFVRNYNMHNMGKTIGELHAMLIECAKGLPKKAETPQVMMIKGGKIQKSKKKSLKAKGKGKTNGKENDKQVYIPKPKNHKPVAKEHPTKDDTCRHCKDVGYWKRNCHVYLANIKRAKHNLDSTYLWHYRLAHISKKRIEKLQQEGILKSTDDESFDQCVSCLSGKMTRKSFLHHPFITFAYDYSRYAYVYLLKHKHEALVKWDTPDKLQQRSVKCIFIGYSKETMGYYFYFPSENKIVVAMYAKFFEKNLITQEVSGRAVDLEEIQDEGTPPSEITSEIPMEVEGFEPPQKEVILIRRSERTHRAPNRLCLNVKVEKHSLGDLNEPASYKAAMLDSESNKWIDAMNAEIQSMIDNMVWVLVDLPPGCETVKSKVDYEEMFSPVVDIRAIRIFISIATFYDYKICQMDVKTAFLNGYLDEDIYMVQPEGFVDPNNPSKTSVSNFTFLILYVDDIIIMGNHIPSLQSVKDYLGKCFAMKDLEEAAFILGIKIYRDRHIPMQEKLDLNKTQGASTPKEVKRMQNVPYALVVGSIISKQSTTAMSTIEAEYIAASEAAVKAVWIRKFISGLGIVPTINEPIRMFCDNSSVLHFSNELGVQRGARHYHRRYHYVRESIALGKIRFLKVHTYDNLADPFTKALSKGKLTQHARSM
nr:hypothetical protein [Tanacetum cinerariifolium]